MISQPLDELYFKWLYSKVDEIDRRHPSQTHWNLLRVLYSTEFIWFIPNDDNRAEDGRMLRHEFLHDQGLDNVDSDWFELPCSFLELLLGLARRLIFEVGGTERGWFWHLMRTLELDHHTDETRIPENQIEDILSRVIHRHYEPDGRGGLFPLRRPVYDQREVELWYQLNAYILEND